VSVAVGTPTRQDADDFDSVSLVVVPKSHAPLADSEAVRIANSFQLADVTLSSPSVALDSSYDTVGDLTLKSAQVALRSTGPDD